MRVRFTYVDFDGIKKSSEADVHEDSEGSFYAVNLAEFGHGKCAHPSVYWHPVRAALRFLLGGREIVSWSEV